MADSKEKRLFVGLRDLTDANRLANKRAEVEGARNNLKRDWALNRAYYAGNQWSSYNPRSGTVETLNIDAGPKWRVRLQSNQIKPGITHYVAQLTKTRPTINAEPDSGSDNDVKSAQLAESLFEYLWDTHGLNGKVQDALVEACLSSGYWSIHWDALAGKPMTFTVDPEGNPIADEELAAVYLDTLKEQLAQAGQDPELAQEIARKTVYLGDMAINVMPGENVLLDPTASRFEDANWAICRHAMDPDEVEARWGIKCQPDSSPQEDYPSPIGQSDNEDKALGLTRNVYIMYIRPCPAVPNGRYVAWIEGPNTILQDVDWPYPFQELPLVKFPGIYRPGSVYDDPITTDGRPSQDDLNKGLSQVVEYRNLTVSPQMLAPYGSLRNKITSEPGAVMQFNPIANLIPQWRDIPALPNYVFGAINDAQMRLDRLFNRMPSTRDQLPARADSGHLLEGMQEAVADQLSPVIIGIEDALARAGHLLASFAQEYYEEERLLKIRGSGGSIQVKKFRGADIAGGFTFRPRYGTGLPRTREGKRTAIMELLEAQLIDPQAAMKHLDLADLKGVQAKMARGEDFAFRTLEKMRKGQPINRQAMAEVDAQIQQFQEQAQQIIQEMQAGVPLDLNQDGQVDEPGQIQEQLQQQWEQLQQAAVDAPWQPLPYENKAASIEVLGDFMNTVEFEGYPEEMQDLFVQRFTLLMQAIQSEQQSDPKLLPKLNVTAKSTVSAPTMSKILAAQGIDSPPEEVAMEPLETAVYDSVDKPDADSAGNDPFTEEEHAQAMQVAEDEHLTAQAKAASDMARAAAAQEQEIRLKEQQMAHAEESHATGLAHQEEKHQADLEAKEAARQAAEQGPEQ